MPTTSIDIDRHSMWGYVWSLSREFPLDWMNRHLSKAEFKVIGSKNFTILHSGESASRQIKVARSKLSLIRSKELQSGMEKYLVDLQ